MKKAFIFPGQGSQYVNMGKNIYNKFYEAKLVFEEVDDSIRTKLSQIIFEGPQKELDLTFNAQPAIMAVSISIIRILEKLGLNLKKYINYVAGHSLGEYSALCATGMFSLRDTAQILRTRGYAMHESCPDNTGSMSAIIGLDIDTVNIICQLVSKFGICQIANDNTNNQIVISGSKIAVEKACEIAYNKGAYRVVHLTVSGAFHSALMQSATTKLKNILYKKKINDPCVPIISNVLARPIKDSKKILELLINQMTSCVRWREIVDWFYKNNIINIFEIGQGRILSGLIKKSNKKINIMSVSTEEDIKKIIKIFIP